MEDEDTRDLVRAEMQTPLFKRSMRLRRGVERLFADAKGKRGLSRLHLRGLRGAEEEFLIGAAIANLMLLVRPADRLARSRRAPPAPERFSPIAKLSRGRNEPTLLRDLSLNSCVSMHIRDMLIGYARVSTDDQNLTLQRAALKEAGCRRTFDEKVSGAKRDRPELARMLDQIRDDDLVVVTRLDRLARSTRDLLDIAEKLNDAGAGLRSLAEPWADTTSPAGRMVLTVFAGIAEFERELIHQRTSSGRIAAKARGVRFGRPSKLTTDQIALGERLIGEGTSVREAAKLLKCHHATLYRALSAPTA